MLTENCLFSRVAGLSSFWKCNYFPLFQKVGKPRIGILAINEVDGLPPQLMLSKRLLYDLNETSPWVNCPDKTPDKTLVMNTNFGDPTGSRAESILAVILSIGMRFGSIYSGGYW